MIPKLVKTIQVAHPSGFNAGPRITSMQIIDTGKGLVSVSFWTDSNGRVVRVDAPVAYLESVQ